MADGLLSKYVELLNQGFTPEQIRQQQDEARAMQFAQLSPVERISMMGYRGGQQLGRGIAGLFGATPQEDPMLKMASQVRQLGSQFDLTSSEGLMQYARALQQVNPQMAQQAAMQARQMMVQEATLGKTRAQEAQALAGEEKTRVETVEVQRKSAREQRIEEELSALPADAKDSDVEAVVRKYGKPDQIFASLERRQKAEADRTAKAELEREKLAAKKEADATKAEQQEKDRELRKELAQMNAAMRSAITSTQRELIQTRIDDLKSKQQEKIEKKEAGKEAAINHASKVLVDVQEANNLVSGTTTGLLGKGTSFVPGTDAYNLNQRLLTIKANLGFDRLQQMRDASPTGGALGQVAVQELNALQSTVGSLELGQSKDELKKNLEKITFHYNNWLKAVRGEPLEPPKSTVTPAGGGWSIRPKQ